MGGRDGRGRRTPETERTADEAVRIAEALRSGTIPPRSAEILLELVRLAADSAERLFHLEEAFDDLVENYAAQAAGLAKELDAAKAAAAAAVCPDLQERHGRTDPHGDWNGKERRVRRGAAFPY